MWAIVAPSGEDTGRSLLDEPGLAALVTRDSMIGTGLAKNPSEVS